MNFVVSYMQEKNISARDLVKPNANSPRDYKIVCKGKPVKGKKNTIFVKPEDIVLLKTNNEGKLEFPNEFVESSLT